MKYLILFFSITSFAQEKSFLIGTRGNEVRIVDYLANNQESLEILKSRTREFDNGNTFVQFQADVAGKNVEILMPSSFEPNTLMEFLIKINTAKVDGAKNISIIAPKKFNVQSPAGIVNKLVLKGFTKDSEKLLKDTFIAMLEEAGADKIISKQKNSQQDWEVEKHIEDKNFKKPTTGYSEVVIDARFFPQFSQNLSEKFDYKNLRIIKNQTDFLHFIAQGNLESSKIILTVPAGIKTNKHFFDLIANTKKYSSLGAKVVGIMPYFHYARTDKKDQTGVTITGTMIASLLERVGTTEMLLGRLHAPQAQGFFRKTPTSHISTRETITQRLASLGVDLVVAPDNGATKEASLFADVLKVPVETINKFRDPITGETSIRGISDPEAAKGKVIAVIDDETASGSTGKNAAEILKVQGADRVIFVVTHLAGNAKKALSSKDIDRIIVTNTLPIDAETKNNPNLEILDVSNEFKKELDRYLGVAKKAQEAPVTAISSRCALAFRMLAF